MIKRAKLFLLFIILALFNSCDESVNTNAEFRERYVLTNIIDCESEKQIAYISKTYDNESTGRNPEIEYTSIKGADVKIWYNYDVYELNDTTIIDNKGRIVPCYVVNGLKLKGDSFIEIEALLSNNILLSSITYIPKVTRIKVESSTAGTISENSQGELNISWRNIGNYIYDPQLVINYYFNADTNSTVIEKIIPLDFIVDGTDTSFVYPKPSNQSNISVARNSLNQAFRYISKGDPNKSNYVIANLRLKLKVYDENLSAYYSSTHQFLDQFSISLDTQVYSNIKSGHGIFASYINRYMSIAIDKEYIKSFGYRYAR